MSGSEAEERIRVKAEAALREVWPSARIVHELMMRQGGCRIDLAAITPDRLIVVEVKSERDVLDRLKRQVEEAREVADGVMVALAGAHYDKAWRDRHICILEASREEDLVSSLNRQVRSVLAMPTNAPARLSMLWASELRRIAGAPAKANRSYSIQLASDSLTGAEVRRRVCAALRARPFPRADDPILSELFPEPSKGSFS